MSPRAAHPHPPDVRQHLLDAALRAFAAHGYEGATIKLIAAEAKVAPGLLYHYFANKEALLTALFERSGALVAEAFITVAGIADPRERLAELLRVSARIVRENEDFWRISYGVRFQGAVLAGLGAGIAAQSAAFHATFVLLLTELGRPDPVTEAWLLFASLDGLFQHYILAPDTYPLDAVVELLITRAGGGAAAETP